MSSARLALIALLTLAGCTREEYRNADLQLDILDIQPAYAERIRVCVEGVRSRTMGAGGGRYALPGLPPDRLAEVTVDVLVEIGTDTQDDTGLDALVTVASTGRVSLSADEPWRQVELEHFADGADAAQDCSECPEPCRTNTNAAPTEEDSWLLATRFLD